MYESVTIINVYLLYLQLLIDGGIALRVIYMLVNSLSDDTINIKKIAKNSLKAGVVITLVPQLVSLFYSYYS